jgi:anti-sigma factor RsiW
MNCKEVEERLDGWVEGSLREEDRRAVAAHLESCGACRAEAGELEALLSAAADLPREISPPRDLWAAIDARLDRPGSGLPRWALVAAALALVLVTAALSSILTHRYDEAMALKLRRSGGGAVTAPASGPVSAPSGDEEARFLAASQELLAGLEGQDLSPETMAIVRRNLEVIDAAIAELHVALARDPGNGELARMLLATYQRKIDLLEQAARSGEG